MLDDTLQISKIDRENMLGLMENFPEQVENAVRKYGIKLPTNKPQQIIIAGMGGSAIGGDILKAYLLDKISIPIFIVCDYRLPRFANDETLVFLISYSGNTEETLSVFSDALRKGCSLITISSNGRLESLCKEHKVAIIKTPSGLSPRTAIAYLFLPMLELLRRTKLVDEFSVENVVRTLREVKEEIRVGVPTEKNLAKQIALKLRNTIPKVYAHTYLKPLAKRFCTQLNENAEVLAHWEEFPECNHNDIMGWECKWAKDFCVVVLRDKEEPNRIGKRIELTKQLAFSHAKDIIELWARGSTRLAKILSTVYLCDYISAYLAILRNVNPTPVKLIEDLKSRLA